MARTRVRRPPNYHTPKEVPHAMKRKPSSPAAKIAAKKPRNSKKKKKEKETEKEKEKEARKQKRAAAEQATRNETLRQIAHITRAANNASFTAGPFVAHWRRGKGVTIEHTLTLRKDGADPIEIDMGYGYGRGDGGFAKK